MRQPVPPSKGLRIRDNDSQEPQDRQMDLIHGESDFNFMKIHLLSHFSHHISQFGNLRMYYKDFDQFAHKEQKKEAWRRWNKNDAVHQIVHTYSP